MHRKTVYFVCVTLQHHHAGSLNSEAEGRDGSHAARVQRLAERGELCRAFGILSAVKAGRLNPPF